MITALAGRAERWWTIWSATCHTRTAGSTWWIWRPTGTSTRRCGSSTTIRKSTTAKGRLGDECSHRLVRYLIGDRGVIAADWVDRTRGIGILCRHPAYGPAYIAHRMRRQSKLILGTVPRSSPKWPLESTVMRLFEELSPEYIAKREEERLEKSPAFRRAMRRAVIAKGPRPCAGRT